MMWGYHDASSWIWMGTLMVLFWAVATGVVVWAVRSFAAPRPTRDDAVDTLRKRFAAGEITQEEFEKARRALQGGPRRRGEPAGGSNLTPRIDREP